MGLTGGLGSGKSTAAAIFAGLGADVLSSDEIGRAMMQPGNDVYDRIVERFGVEMAGAGGGLDRAALARVVFADPARLEALNAIVHPAVIAEQERRMRAIALDRPRAVVVVESALIFETRHGGEAGWRDRFDRIVLVTAAEESRIARFVKRSAAGRVLSDEERETLEAEAHRRIAAQVPDEQKAARCDYVLSNDGGVAELEWQVDRLWPLLLAAA